MPTEDEELPGFTQPTRLEDELPQGATLSSTPGAGPSTPTSPAQPTTPIRSLPPIDGSTEPNPPSTPRSSTASGDVTEAVSDAIDNLAGDSFEIAGFLINRAIRARSHTQTNLWLVSPEESTAFAEAAGRIAQRRLPDELQEEGDVSDLFVMGTVALGYVAHNAMGLTAAEFQQAQAQALAPPPAPPPPMHPPETPGPATTPPPAPAATVQTQTATPPDEPVGSYGAVAPTPAPPSVISPAI